MLNKNKINDEELFQQFLRKSVLKAIDSAWIEQVDYLQQLKSNVNQRQKVSEIPFRISQSSPRFIQTNGRYH